VKKEPWKARCVYVHPTGANRESVTPRGWTQCPSHAFNLGEQLDETRGSVAVTLEMPALGKPIGDLSSAEWEAIRLRLIRTAPTVTL
jgi:hypothetical protein